jgi:hypothetical protein
MRHTEIRMSHLQQAAAPATAANPTKAEVKEQIKQTIQAAQEAAREASQIDAGRNGPVIADQGVQVVPAVPPIPPIAPGGGFTGQPGDFGPGGIPPQVVDISIAFFIMCAVMVIGWPIARAFGKRLERRADAPMASAGTSEQLQRIEQAVDAMAIEIERISESQRFMARLQNSHYAEKPALPADHH